MEMPDFLRDMFEGLVVEKTPQYIIMYNCAIKMDDSTSRCQLAGHCGHYAYCLAEVTRKGYTGWQAKNIHSEDTTR